MGALQFSAFLVNVCRAMHDSHTALDGGPPTIWRQRTICCALPAFPRSLQLSPLNNMIFQCFTRTPIFLIPTSMCAGAHTELSSSRARVLRKLPCGPCCRLFVPALHL